MFKKALALDSKLFLEKKNIRAKRPSEYWLEFLKKHVLIEQKKGISWYFLLFIIPVILFIVLIIFMKNDTSGENYGGWFAGLFFLTFVLITAVVVFVGFRKRAFVNPNAFDHLAKFIVKIKGDTFKNLIGISLDTSVIENNANLINLESLGLKETRQIKYAPYQLERYQANLRLKDDSFCSVSLFQISLKTTTTKRRSSGKTKTKSKHKHKFYYILSLKLNAAAYQVSEASELLKFNGSYEISNRTENGFHLLKIKFKEKLMALPTKITANQKKKPSIFTTMLQYVFDKQIVTPKSNQLQTP